MVLWEIVMNVLASRGYENELVIQKHCTTSSGLHDLTLSLLRLVLLPGYYFLWQHLSWWGEQLWKDTDNWLLCILWTGSPYMSSEWKAQRCRPRQRDSPESSVWFICFQPEKRTSSAIQTDLEVIFQKIQKMWLKLKNEHTPIATISIFFCKDESLPSYYCYLIRVIVELCNLCSRICSLWEKSPVLTNDYCTAIFIVLYEIQCSFQPKWEQCFSLPLHKKTGFFYMEAEWQFVSYPMQPNCMRAHCHQLLKWCYYLM